METAEILLRLVLFSGLVFHKLVWEVMKRRSGTPPVVQRPPKSLLKSIVKMVKTMVLAGIIVQTLFLNVFPIFDDPTLIRTFGLSIYLVGLLTALIGRIQLGNNWANLEDYQVIPDQHLVHTGIYRYIRHPIYTGDVLLIIGLELALNSWLVLGAIPLIIIVIRQALAEETVLANAFSAYGEYQKHTKMFIPYIV